MIRRGWPWFLVFGCPGSEDTDGSETPDHSSTPSDACTPQPWPIDNRGHQLDRIGEPGVVAWSPTSPRGLVYVFHADKKDVSTLFTVEHEEFYNELAARDLAYVMVNSTGPDWSGTSGPDNPDVQRMAVVRDSLIELGSVTSTTPVFAVGFSGGAGFDAVFANATLDLGWDFRGFSAHNSGGYQVAPVASIHVAHENDPTFGFERADQVREAQEATGAETLVWKYEEEPLTPLRFTKIAGIDEADSQIWFDELVAQGIVDVSGVRVVPIEELDSALTAFDATSAVGGADRASSQVKVLMRVHIFAADRACEEAEFFEAQL